MSDPFVGEIRIFPFNFPPTGWAFCSGQLLPISQNTALFSLLGTFYGGDGKSTFALPDMDGNVAIQQGQGQGLSEYFLGQSGGTDTVTLLQTEIPLHSHKLRGQQDPGDLFQPEVGGVGNSLARSSANGSAYQSVTNTNLVQLNPQALTPYGGSLPHNNMMPYLTLNYCIALQGIFPARP